MDEKYQSIINMQNPTSLKHPRMSRLQRAAQFAPFAALTGHDEKIKETARLTESKIDLDDEQLILLNNKLNIINNFKDLETPVKIVYFVQDLRKKGGKYLEKIGLIKKIDQIERIIIFKDQVKINIDDIIEIDSELIKEQFI